MTFMCYNKDGELSAEQKDEFKSYFSCITILVVDDDA